jgi:ABC-type nitrate/sulfonate/bicarbonate transport system substrate-binding protein
MPFRPLWIFALLVGLVFSAKAFSQTLTPITVQVNWNHQFQFAGFYAAIKQGYYQNAGLDVTVKSWKPGTNMVNEVVNGRADFATAYSSVIVDYAKGAPIKLVMSSFQFSPMVLLAHKPVEDLKDMSGMDVMHFSNLQIQSLINKANTVTQKPLKSIPLRVI